MKLFLKKHGAWMLTLLVALLAFPPQWYPDPARVKFTEWFGAASFRPLPASTDPRTLEPEIVCPPDPSGWRDEQQIEGVQISASPPCVADNPFAIAAFVKGTNNVSEGHVVKEWTDGGRCCEGPGSGWRW